MPRKGQRCIAGAGGSRGRDERSRLEVWIGAVGGGSVVQVQVEKAMHQSRPSRRHLTALEVSAG